jgi:hypothetical protein
MTCCQIFFARSQQSAAKEASGLQLSDNQVGRRSGKSTKTYNIAYLIDLII